MSGNNNFFDAFKTNIHSFVDPNVKQLSTTDSAHSIVQEAYSGLVPDELTPSAELNLQNSIKIDKYPTSIYAPLSTTEQFSKIIPSLGSNTNFPNAKQQLEESPHVGRFKVRLVSVIGLNTAFTEGDINSVIFEVSPTLSESGGVEYSQNSPIHNPGSIQVYKSTNSRNFTISAKFVSRNTQDAYRNIQYLQTLRAWRFPYFGQSLTSNNQQSTTGSVPTYNGNKSDLPTDSVELLGAPPEVLYLYGYSTSKNDSRSSGTGNLNRIPVVMTNLQIDYPSDVDYIPLSLNAGANTEMFPVIMSVSVTLLETHSPTEMEKFSLSLYKQGKLPGY